MKKTFLFNILIILTISSFFIPHLWVLTTLSISLVFIEKFYNKKTINVLK